MDFSSLKRRDLQILCKKNNIPANTTNAAMADALASLPTVEGLDEYLGKPECEVQGSPERSVITSPNVPRTTARQKAFKEEPECSKMATRTRCGTRTRVVEGTDTRKTPATRTTRKRACQEATIKKEMEKDLQAEFEIDMEESEISENNGHPGGELEDISTENSEVTVETEGQVLSESQIEAENEVEQVNDGQNVIDVDDSKENQEEENVENEVQEEPVETSNDSKKVDFHSLSRKDLQNLCKKNKIPANTTNAVMADALKSLEIVEGLQEFMKDCGSLALLSPPMRGITSSCGRRSRTTLKITKEEPRSSKLITKSCRGSRRRILEETEHENDVPDTPAAPQSTPPKDAQAGPAHYDREIRDSIQKKGDNVVHKSEQKKLENSSVVERECAAAFSNCELEGLETSEVSGGVEFNISNSPNSILNVEKESEETLSTEDENVVEEEIVESSEDTEVFANDLDHQVVDKCATENEDQIFASGDDGLENTEVKKLSKLQIDAGSESEDGQLENLVTASDSAAEDQMSKDFVCESSTLADQVFSLESNEESHLEKSKPEKMVTFASDVVAHTSAVELEGSDQDQLFEESEIESTSKADKPNPVERESEGSYTEDASETSDYESESEGSYTEEEMWAKSVTESTTHVDNSSLEVNVESESEDSCIEDQKFDSETISHNDQVIQEINVDIEIEEKQLEKLDTTTDSTEDEKIDSESTSQDDKVRPEINVYMESEKNQLEKLNTTTDSATDGNAETVDFFKLDTESTVQADLCAPTEKGTPLYNKSMRKLKRMLKEKLQAEKLAKRLENLTLEETQIPLAKVEGLSVESQLSGSAEALAPQMMPDEKAIEESEKEASNDSMEQKDAFQKNLKDEALSNDQTDDSSENAVTNSDVDTATRCPVDILQDNEVVSEDAVTGNISVVTCPPQSTPSNISSKTKKTMFFTSPTKTPKSAGRKNRDLDINKENIDNSAASKTEPGKIKIAVNESGKLLSAMSMGKLKKEFKMLQQHSEKKKALQSRSENNCLLASP